MAETANSSTETETENESTENAETTGSGNGGDSAKTLTQAEVDKIVEQRLARERKKFADYDDLKAAKAQLDKIEADKLSEVEKANKERDKALARVSELEGIALDSAIREAARDANADPTGVLDALKGSASDLLDPADMAGTMEKLLEQRPNLVVAKPKPTPSADQGARGGSGTQLTREDLKNMTPQQIDEAHSEGRLKDLLGS